MLSGDTLFKPLLGIALLASVHAHANEFEDAIQQSLEEVYSFTVLLTAGSNIQLGFLNFDPNELTGLDDDNLGNDAAIESRERLRLFTLPARYEFTLPDDRHKLAVGARLGYMSERQSGYIDSTATGERDLFESTSLIGSLGLDYQYLLSDHWQARAGIAGHLIRFENRTQFNTPESRALSDSLNGVLTNFHASAWLVEPTVGVGYNTVWRGVDTRFLSEIHYLSGGALRADADAHDVQPQAAYWRNGVQVLQPVFLAAARRQGMLYALSQVHVDGDLITPVGSGRYFELGVGWYIDTSDLNRWVSNLGLAANINYGSDFRGGTLSLLYNVE